MLNGKILKPVVKENLHPVSKEMQESLLGKRSHGGKVDGLRIGSDPVTGEKVPCTDHRTLVRHLQQELEVNGYEKGEGANAYASTFAFHQVLFTTDKTRQDCTVVRTKTRDDMRQSRESTITALQDLIAELSPLSAVEVAQKSASIRECFHFYISDVDKCSFEYLTYTRSQQQHAAWLF